MKICKVENCSKKVLALGFCSLHYQRYKIYGNPTEPYRKNGRYKTGEFYKCVICGKEFYRYPSNIKKGTHKCCSRECGFKLNKGRLKIIKPIEERIWRIYRSGYLETTIRRKRIKKHRWIVETQVLKRPLRKEEIIHHLNGVKTDNRKENLAICNNHTHYEFIKQLQERIRELENQ